MNWRVISQKQTKPHIKTFSYWIAHSSPSLTWVCSLLWYGKLWLQVKLQIRKSVFWCFLGDPGRLQSFHISCPAQESDMQILNDLAWSYNLCSGLRILWTGMTMMSGVILGTYWVPLTALIWSVPERYIHADVWTLVVKTARTLMQWGMSTSIFISLLTFANVSKSIEYMASAADDGDAGRLISFGSEK